MSDRPDADAQPRFRCDFCGSEVPRVRRVALDRDYDRLQKPHRVQYACPECSERKERERSQAREAASRAQRAEGERRPEGAQRGEAERSRNGGLR